VKGIFRRKAFWFTLLVLLFAACIYPPFLLMTEGGITAGRKWDWIFTLPTPQEVPRIDLAMLFIEAIIAVLIATWNSIDPFCRWKGFEAKKVIPQQGRETGQQLQRKGDRLKQTKTREQILYRINTEAANLISGSTSERSE